MRILFLVVALGVVTACATDGSFVDSDITVTFPKGKLDTDFITD